VSESLSPILMTHFLFATVCQKNETVKIEYLKVQEIIFSSFTNFSSFQWWKMKDGRAR